MADYLIESINNSLLSTFISGMIGTFTVLIGSIILSKTLQSKKPS